MSANIKASVDGTQAIIGVGGVDQMTVSNAGVVTANSFVGAMNGNASSATALATGSTTARTLANRFADVVNVLDFGADPTGVIDSYAAVLAAVSASKGTLYFPSGTYKISNGIQINKSINIVGDGPASKIIFVGSNTLFQLLYQYPNPPRYQIESLSIFSDNVISDCCIELKFTGGPGVLGGEDSLYISNVFINCDSNFYWKKALFMNRSAGVYISNSSFVNGNSGVAQSTPGVIGIHVLNDLVGHNIIRALHISNTYIQRFYENIKLENSAGNNIESVYIVNAELLGSKGIVGTGATHAISIISTHFDQIISAIDLPFGANVRIESCDIRSGYTSTEPLVSIGSVTGGFSDLISIVGSQFVFTNPKAIRFLSGNGKVVAANIFYGNLSPQVAISIEGNTGFTRCYGNQYTNVLNAYSNTSTGSAVRLGLTGTFDMSVTNNIFLEDGIIFTIS